MMLKKDLVVIGTSGSTDYLTDPRGDQRFWPEKISADEAGPPLSAEDHSKLKALFMGCDGIHDEGAPAIYLCTRCFPDSGRGDHGSTDEDDHRDDRRETEE